MITSLFKFFLILSVNEDSIFYRYLRRSKIFTSKIALIRFERFQIWVNLVNLHRK